MANLGSEVVRLYSALDTDAFEKVVESRTRALYIVDELLSCPQMQGRSGEIEILRDVIHDTAEATPKYLVKGKDLEAYFMPFAMRTLQSI